MHRRQKVWPQLGRVCGNVYGWVHRGQVRVERRWDKVDDMGMVVLGVGGMAIVALLVLLELVLSAVEAAAASAAEDDDEEPAMAGPLTLPFQTPNDEREASEGLPATLVHVRWLAFSAIFPDGRLLVPRAGPGRRPPKIMALTKPQGCRFADTMVFTLRGTNPQKSAKPRAEPRFGLWRDAGAAPAS